MEERCPATDKKCYTREEADKKAAYEKNRTVNGYIRFYLCQFCNFYHLTHKKKHSWQ